MSRGALRPGMERRAQALNALDRAADELAARDGITHLQARRKLQIRAHILTINKSLGRQA